MEDNSIHQFGMARKANDPPKIQIFAWTVALEIIIERRFRGEIPRCVFPFMACLSTKKPETKFFIHFDTASSLWAGLCGKANILWAAPVSCKALLMENIFAFRKKSRPKHYGSV